jgi:adenylate kinase family enzyme
MQRILLLGPGGAGKSTLARALGARLALPVIHLDREYWRPGWVAPARAEWLARVTALAAAERWVMDGNFSASLEPRLARCDTVLLVVPPARTCLARVVRRRLAHRGTTRVDMAPGCEERLTLEFLWWIASYRRRRLPAMRRRLAALPPSVAVHELRSPDAVVALLAAVDRAPAETLDT